MTANDIFTNVDLLRALATVLAFTSGTAGVYVITLWAGAKGATHWRTIRGYIPNVIEQVDEETDVFPKYVDKQLDKLVTAQWDKMIALVLPEFLHQVEKLVDAKLDAPPQEATPLGEK